MGDLGVTSERERERESSLGTIPVIYRYYTGNIPVIYRYSRKRGFNIVLRRMSAEQA